MKEKHCGICYVCGKPLAYDENDENCSVEEIVEDSTEMKSIKCSHCGTLYNYYIEDDTDINREGNYIECNDQGFGNCGLCGGIVVWSGDFMRSDYYNDPVTGDDLSEDDDAIVRSMVCGHCGSPIEVWEPSQNEMKSGLYPFWNNNEVEDLSNG